MGNGAAAEKQTLIGIDALPHEVRPTMLLGSDACWSAVEPVRLDAFICGARHEEVHWHDDAAVLKGEVDLSPHGIALIDACI